MSNPNLVVIPSQIAGRGVITTQDIQKGEIIEICPVIVLLEKEMKLIHQTKLHDYYFNWEDNGCAICLGLGSIYNHARQPNADYQMDYKNQTIDFYCIRDIAAGEEITVSYLHTNKNERKLWFEVS
ncbi:MAG: SET domain-containing protein [Saprospiraceae bacterium]